jgi:hypothetical protein
VSAVVLNIVIGLVTSVLSGGSVWAWRRAAIATSVHRKAAFFGLAPGSTCLVAMPNRWDRPGATSHNDVYALVEVVKLADELKCPTEMVPANQLHGGNGNRTEFCIGGPVSNPRTGALLAGYLPGVAMRDLNDGHDPLAIIAAGQRFQWRDQRRYDYALVAKFTPAHSHAPVIIICGQTSISNRAAISFLRREYLSLAKRMASPDRFCLVLKISAVDGSSYQAVELAADVTTAAFTPHQSAPAIAGNSSQS